MTARSIGDVANAFVGYRNPDRTKVPRRNSYDVSDPRADVFKKILDGSKVQGRAWRAAKLETLRQWIHRHWAEGYEGEFKLRRVDHYVLGAVLSFVNYATGELFPSYDEIAKAAGVCRATVAESLQRLKHWKIITWVRRSVVAETAGEMGPQREQTSNAYHFGCEREMEGRALAYFRMALRRNLGRLGGAVAAIVGKADKPLPPLDPALEASLGRLGAMIEANASPGESASASPSRWVGARVQETGSIPGKVEEERHR